MQRSVEDGDDASRAALARLEGALAAVDGKTPSLPQLIVSTMRFFVSTSYFAPR